MYYEINEKAAWLAHDANSFRDFCEGAATEDYRRMVDEAAKIAADRKEALPEEYHDKIDALLNLYSRKLADWKNQYYQIEGMCPSVMIAGSSNFPVRKKEKQNSRRDAHWKARDNVDAILKRIKNIGCYSHVIRSDDKDAIDKLKSKIEHLKTLHENTKGINAYLRKHGTLAGCPYPETPKNELRVTSRLPEIRRLEARVKVLEKLQSKDGEAVKGWKFKGGEVIFNDEAMRVQILFDAKPPAEIIQKLKRNAFKWSPKSGLWQRLKTGNAVRAVKQLDFTKEENV